MSIGLGRCSDGALTVRARAGEEAAFAEIMHRYRAPIYRLARAQTRDEEAALDLTQECFAAAWHNLGRYDPQRPLRAWLARIALNRCRDWHRRRRVRAFLRFEAPAGTIAAIPDPAPAADAVAADRAALIRLSGAVAALPAALREVLLLRTVEDMDQASVAALLGISAKAVETRLYRARRRLAEMLGDR